MALPRFVVLKSKYNNKYLHYVQEDVEVHGFLRFSGEELVSPYVKFEVEIAKSGSGLVHLRSYYNNKYWVRSSPTHSWVVAAADEPEEDQSKWSCTLFKPVYVDADEKTVRFLHVQLGHYASLSKIAEPYNSCLYAGSKDVGQTDVCTFIDWEYLMIMPKHVAFMGDNGYYLGARSTEGHQYLQFSSTQIEDETVGYEVFTAGDGSIRIKSDYFDKFWRRSPSPHWIWADTDDTTSNSDTLFWPIRVDNAVVALHNSGNNNFCKRFTTGNMISFLSANDPTISVHSRLQVSELVLSRQIYNVDFHLKDARIYNQRVLTMATGVAANRTEKAIDAEVKLPYTDTKTSTWNSSVSLKLGVKTSIQTGIPFILGGNVEISNELTGAYEWGEPKTTSTTEVETMYKVSVPPMMKVTVTLLATAGSFDVPFSYTQRDTLTNGQQVTYNMDDGIYTGINNFNFNFNYKIEQEKL